MNEVGIVKIIKFHCKIIFLSLVFFWCDDKNKKFSLSLALFFSTGITPGCADVFSEAHKLGAFSGAIKFCENKHGGNEDRYQWARLRVAQEVSDISGKNKTKALFASNNA